MENEVRHGVIITNNCCSVGGLMGYVKPVLWNFNGI